MVEKHVQVIQTLFQAENQYWKDLHSAIAQYTFLFHSTASPFILFRSFIPANHHPSVENFKSKHSDVVLSSINKAYLIKFDEITNRLSSIESCPTYSPPNSPAPLCFSPTILQDEPSRQTQTRKDSSSDLMKPRIIIHRIDPALLIDCLKKRENEYIKPRTISLRRRNRPNKKINRTITSCNTFCSVIISI